HCRRQRAELWRTQARPEGALCSPKRELVERNEAETAGPDAGRAEGVEEAAVVERRNARVGDDDVTAVAQAQEMQLPVEDVRGDAAGGAFEAQARAAALPARQPAETAERNVGQRPAVQ